MRLSQPPRASCLHIDMDALDVTVRMHPGLSQLAADSRLLYASKGDAEVRVVAAIDPNHSGLDLARNPMAPRDFPREHCSAETIRRVIGHLDGLLLRLEGGN